VAKREDLLVRVGETQHFEVFYERRLGERGEHLAEGLLDLCEADYERVRAWFGGITPHGMPFECRVIPGRTGAWHNGCHGTVIFLNAFGADITNPRTVAWGNVAEIVEVFSAAQNVGWDCGHNNGEGLSRVLATVRYPDQLDGYWSAPDWLDSHRPDYVTRSDHSDVRTVSTGCAALFLNYLHYQLGYSWRDIVANGQPTLGETHRALTASRSDGWKEFRTLVARHYPPTVSCGLTRDNIFPL
jgi:hypothetical protein